MTKGRRILAAAFAALAAVALAAGLLLFWLSANGPAAPAASDTVSAGPGNSRPADSFETAPSSAASDETGAESAYSGTGGTQIQDPWVCTGWTSHGADGSFTTAVTYYNEAGQPIRQDHLDSAGTLLGYWLYEPTQAQGQPANKIQYYTAQDGAAENWTLEILDEAGRTLRSEHYSEDGTLMDYTRYQYDAKGWEIAADTYSPDDTLESQVDGYEYDVYGNVTARLYSGDGADGDAYTVRVEYTYERLSAVLARQQAAGIAY